MDLSTGQQHHKKLVFKYSENFLYLVTCVTRVVLLPKNAFRKIAMLYRVRCHRSEIYHKDGKGFILCYTHCKIHLMCYSGGSVSLCQLNMNELLQVVLNLRTW